MPQIAAKSVQICVLTREGLNYNDVQNWPSDARAAWEAFGGAIMKLRQKHGASVPVEMYVCPVNIPENAVIIANNGLDPSLLPAVQVWAEYPDGTGASYFLSKNLSERFTGIKWTTSDVQPYVDALLYRAKPADIPIICKIVPPLCNVGGWVWLALAIGATAKASSAKGVGRAAWGTGAALLWQGWYKRGGLDQIKQAAGIGAKSLRYQGKNDGSGKAQGLIRLHIFGEEGIYNLSQNNMQNTKAIEIIRMAEGNPNLQITVYRGTVGDKINTGDWVFLTREEAERYTKTKLGTPIPGAKVVSKKLKAKNVYWTGKNLEFTTK
jgi:hypothetical protein